ncbi:MAG: hypothetical protein F6K24_03540 [Okeania sp. SIO2D1]|nr:hypothetical protein [Okeania sp. SIO2D1]
MPYTYISFAKTLPEFLANKKTCTRRQWKPRHVKKFNCGDLVVALDRDRRAHGKQIGLIRLTAIYQEQLSNMPDSDVAAEGFPELSKEEFIEQFFDGNALQMLTVVRFKMVIADL